MRSALTACVAVTLLAACSSTSSGDVGSQTSGTLRYAYAFTPVAALSPYSDDAVTSYGVGATETLVKLDGAGTPEPSLATAWTHPDDTTWKLTLRAGVTFQDGTPMTAAAVADGLNNAAKASPSPRSLSGTSITAAADGDSEVTITTKAADPVLIQRLTSPELAVLSARAYVDPARPTPVGTGTGPYTITKLNGTASATLAANPAYWGGTPALAGIDLTFVADGAARAAALRSGQVDLAQALPAAQLDQVAAEKLVAVPLPRTVSVHLTQSSAVFKDPAQREAARLAIEPLDIAGTIYGGHADKAVGLFSPSVSTWAADRPAATHPAAAKASGSITLATFSDRPEMSEIAAALADALRKAGFTVKTVVREYNQLEKAFLDGTYDAVIMSRSYGQDTADPVSYLQADYSCDGGYNISRSCSKPVDAELTKAAALTDVAARDAAAVQVEAGLLGNDIVVPLVHDRTQFGTSGTVTGLAKDPWERAVVTAQTKLG